ncbi:metallophosphoesterase family protein [Henriciella marina]|uniref:metallophosphoesterase family protein n=1 Tax=Henriciella marina TaxID=453851 RepID=UPI00058B2C63|nr:metallophosphoesterase family protein [Henriciella marina]
MLRFLSKTVDKSVDTHRPSAPAGKRAYAIGDVHGRLDLLNDLLAQIEDDIAGRRPKQTHIIFLGDLIDRGPHSRHVVERLIDYAPSNASCHFLMGNHEEVLVRGLRGEPHLLDGWIQHGGDTTAESYGVDAAYLRSQGDDALEHALLSAIPESHIRFMAGFLDSIQFGDYLLVHAGIRPGTPLDDQSPSDMRWIRKEFLESTRQHGSMIVHGHSVEEKIMPRSNRIGLDTGAYRTGILSAVRLEGDQADFIQSREHCAARTQS